MTASLSQYSIKSERACQKRRESLDISSSFREVKKETLPKEV